MNVEEVITMIVKPYEGSLRLQDVKLLYMHVMSAFVYKIKQCVCVTHLVRMMPDDATFLTNSSLSPHPENLFSCQYEILLEKSNNKP